MNFSELISKKKEQIKDCENQIKDLQKDCKNEIYQEDKDKLIQLLEQKLELLNSLNVEEDSKEFTKKLETINEKIYKQYIVFKQIIKDNQDFTKDSTNNFNKAFNNFDLNRLGNLNYDIFSKIFLSSKNHPLVSIFILYVFGGGLFAYYFYFHLKYFPNINKENFLYYSLVIILSISLIAVVIGISIAIVLSISKETFKYVNTKVSIVFISISIFVLWTLYYYKVLFNYYIAIIFITMVAFAVSHILIWLNYIFSTYFDKLPIINKILSRKFFQNLTFLKIVRGAENLITAFMASLISVFTALLLVLSIKKILPTNNLPLIFLIIAIGMLPIIRQKSIIIFLSIIGSLSIAYLNLLPLAIRFAGLGNYTIETLVVDSKAYIPKESFDLIKDSGNFIIKKPKILSNVGEDYLVELNKDNKRYRFTIPKSLVKSQVITTPNQEKSNQTN